MQDVLSSQRVRNLCEKIASSPHESVAQELSRVAGAVLVLGGTVDVVREGGRVFVEQNRERVEGVVSLSEKDSIAVHLLSGEDITWPPKGGFADEKEKASRQNPIAPALDVEVPFDKLEALPDLLESLCILAFELTLPSRSSSLIGLAGLHLRRSALKALRRALESEKAAKIFLQSPRL